MWRRAISYIHYLINSRIWGHGIHSPFAYKVVKEVIDKHAEYYVFQEIEALRGALLNNKQTITLTDFGAGSKIKSSNKRTVQSIAKNTLKKKKYAKLLFRLIDHFEYKNILELGTSLGITSAYLASVSDSIQVTTIEGDPEIAKIAQSNFDRLGLNNITLINNIFESALPEILDESWKLDLVFIDGHHTYEATITNFKKCLPHKHNNSVFVIDDINWSNEMIEAWKTIVAHEEVTLSIDLYEMGLIFFRAESSKQNLVIYY